jgi:PKD repeat protein
MKKITAARISFILFIAAYAVAPHNVAAQCSLKIVTADHGCAPFSAIFSRADMSGKKARLLRWDFGDFHIASDSAVILSHSYIPGKYSVKLQVTYSDNTTCAAEATPITVFAPPTAIIANIVNSAQCFIYDSIYNNFCFKSVSKTDGSGAPIVKYLWNFGDGGTSAKDSPCHTYQDPGLYRPILTVTDTNGCSAMVAYPGGITVLKEISNVVLSGMAIAAVRYPASYTVSCGFGGSKTYDWDFGNGKTILNSPDSQRTLAYSDADYNAAPKDTDGSAIIYVKTKTMLGSGCSERDTFKVHLIRTGAIAPILLSQSLRVFPNPMTNEINIIFDSKTSGYVSISIADVLGKTIKTMAPVRTALGKNAFMFPVSDLQKGVYVFKMTDGINEISRQIIKN